VTGMFDMIFMHLASHDPFWNHNAKNDAVL
jgi:hypothetical protein